MDIFIESTNQKGEDALKQLVVNTNKTKTKIMLKLVRFALKLEVVSNNPIKASIQNKHLKDRPNYDKLPLDAQKQIDNAADKCVNVLSKELNCNVEDLRVVYQ